MPHYTLLSFIAIYLYFRLTYIMETNVTKKFKQYVNKDEKDVPIPKSTLIRRKKRFLTANFVNQVFIKFIQILMKYTVIFQ